MNRTFAIAIILLVIAIVLCLKQLTVISVLIGILGAFFGGKAIAEKLNR